MKIVVAPNAFKGCLSASEAAQAMATGIRRAFPHVEIVAVPVADGGDGLVDVAVEALGGTLRTVSVTGPLFEPRDASFCYVEADRFAAVEMALASGLALVPPDGRDPTRTTTRGTGELIAAALDLGVSRIGVGIGGSATNDGGIGMASALGVRFLDAAGSEVAPVGGELTRIRRIDVEGLDPRVRQVRIEAVCDVDNPLCGPRGAAHVYGPQKGASAEQVRSLDDGLGHLADLIERDLGIKVREMAGAGAAGGLGAGLHAFLGAEIRRGVDLVLDLVALDAKLEGADLVLTGEGQIDFQTAFGKAPAGVGTAASRRRIPCVAIAGGVGEGTASLTDVGIVAVFSLCSRPMTLDDAMTQAETLLASAAEQVVRVFAAAPGGRT
ncbi:MAG: glycerate kinase [Rhodospirillales bacterium]